MLDRINKNHIILFFLFIQITFVSYTFPAAELFSETPLFYIDNGFHWYYLKLISNLALAGSFYGYDPYFSAGIPGSFASDVSGHIPQLFSAFLQESVSEIKIWKFFVFGASVLSPILPGLTLKNLDFNRAQIFAGMILSIFMWWISWFHWFHVAGMASYVFSCYFSFYILSKIIHNQNAVKFSHFFILSILFGILIFLHPLAIIPFGFAFLSYFIFNNKEFLEKNAYVYIICCFIVGLLLNLGWLIPFFAPNYDTGHNVINFQAYFKPTNIYLELLGVWTERSHGGKIYALLFILALIAAFRASAAQRKLFIWPFLLTWIILQIYAATASFFPILARLTQPNRFAPAGYLFLIIPAALAIQPFNVDFKKIFAVKNFSLVSAYSLAAVISLINIFELYRELSYENHGHYAALPPQVKGIGPYSNFVINTLSTQTDTSARVLFETAVGRIHDSGHLAGYYAYMTNREFIGGPYPFSSFAGFWDGFVFGSPINDIPPERFSNYLKLYNIGWIMAYSNQSKNYLKQFENLHPGPTFKELQFYTVNPKTDFFIQGSGIISERKHNLIALDKLSGKTVEIKYHYFDNLTSDISVKIEPSYQMDDPIPFIKLIDPPSALKIYFNP